MKKLSPHLRRDGDDPGVGTPWLVTRQARECATDLARAGKVTTPRQYPAVAANLLAYHASFVLQPLASAEIIRLGARVNGKVLRLAMRKSTSDLHVYREIFLNEALKDLAQDWLVGAQTIVDLGSNIGLATAYLSCWAREAAFYCAEPAAENNLVAERNLFDNGIVATIAPVAVSDHEGNIEFYPNGWWASCSTVRSVADTRTLRSERFESALTLPPVSVRATTVAAFLEHHRLDRVDLMKIDIEGAEQDVLKAETDWLDSVQTVAIEIHRKYVDPAPILATFRRHGLRQRRSAGPLDLFSR